MANLSFMPISAGVAGRLIFRPIYPQVVTTTTTVKTGTGGIDVGDGKKRKGKRGIIKPTGLLDRRVEETRKIAEEVAQELKDEFLPQEAKAPVTIDQPVFPRVELTEIEQEIARLLHKKLITEEDEEVLCLLLLSMM